MMMNKKKRSVVDLAEELVYKKLSDHIYRDKNTYLVMSYDFYQELIRYPQVLITEDGAYLFNMKIELCEGKNVLDLRW